MKAKIFESKAKNNAVNMSGARETVERLRAVIVHKGQVTELVDARLYMGRSRQASTVYCSVWIYGAGLYLSGRGTAGGYGYHKTSAALDSALAATGVELYGSAYGEPRRWDQDWKREKTAAEMATEKRRINKTRCYFGGAGESAMREAIKAVGLESKRLGKMPGKVIVL